MRFAINTILIIAMAGVLGYSGYEFTRTPCDRVLAYSVGRFDGKFGLSQSDFIKYVEQAEQPWEKAAGKNLFEYKEDAAFQINLIYDERQRETVQKQRTESGLNAAESFFRNLDAKFSSTKAEYDSKVASYEAEKARFESRKEAYEKDAAYWNTQGGAPSGKYEELENERRAVNSMAAALNSRAEELNRLAQNLNTTVAERNRAAEEYNKVVESYNEKYGGHVEFDQAEYDGQGINIYQFSDSKSLIVAMAHEFGHALDMDHVENSQSIMYYLRNTSNTPSVPTPTEEDLAELKRVCKL